MDTESVIKHNLELMLTKRKGSMPSLLLEESVGGNAGTFQGYSCAGANFLYAGDTGRIFTFKNYSLADQPLIEGQELHPGLFRIAVNWEIYYLFPRLSPKAAQKAKGLKATIFFKIVDSFLEKNSSFQAITNLGKTVKLYNQIVAEDNEKLRRAAEAGPLKLLYRRIFG